MNISYSISTINYDGYDYDTIFSSLQNLGVKQTELALIVGSISNLSEKDLTKEYVESLLSKMQKHNIACSSLACHIQTLDINNANEMFCKRIKLSYYLNCPRIILYCARNCSLDDFLFATKEAQELALKLGIKILIENPGDQKDGTINSAYDIQPFLSKVDHQIFGVNFDPGNFASHRPELDIYEHAKMALPYCEHMHIKDLTKDEKGVHFCAIGDGICKYDKLLQDIKKQGPSIFSVEAPFRLLRNLNGTGAPAAEKIPIQKIEELIAKSINFINKYIY